MRKPLLFAACLLSVLLAAISSSAARADEKTVPPELLEGLKNADPSVRIKAIMGLSKLGVEAVPPLIEGLKDKELDVQQAAAYGLRLLRVEPKPFVAALRPYAKDENPTVRRGVMGALAKCGPDALPLLLPAVQDAEPKVEQQALQSLQNVLQKTPTVANEVLPALTRALQHETPEVRVAAVQVLGRCGPDAVRPLLGALEDKEVKVRAYAAASLILVKPEPNTVLPTLVKRLKAEPDAIVRQSLLRTLGTLGPDAVVPLTEALQDKEAVVQMAALNALGQIGPKAKEALPALKELASKAEDPRIRSAAGPIIAKLGPDALPVLVELLKVDDSATRKGCLKALGQQKDPPPKSAVPNLSLALTDKDPEVRALAAHLLGQIGPDAKEAVPALTKAAQESEGQVRDVIKKALQKIQEK
jgi:HEAT repeat protein